MGEDVPFTFKTLLLARRIRSISNSHYVYRRNDLSLGGIIEVLPTAEKLYEKCFICSHLVYDLIRLIPHNELAIRKEYYAVSKYIISLFPSYLMRFDKSEYASFKSICRRSILKDLKLIKLLSLKNRIIYFFKVIFG